MHGAPIDLYRPLSRRLDRCNRVIRNESRDPFGGNMYYVTMQITFLTRKFRNGERNLHCDVVHITTKWVSSLTLDCNGVFAIKAYSIMRIHRSTTEKYSARFFNYLIWWVRVRVWGVVIVWVRVRVGASVGVGVGLVRG